MYTEMYWSKLLNKPNKVRRLTLPDLKTKGTALKIVITGGKIDT